MLAVVSGKSIARNERQDGLCVKRAEVFDREGDNHLIRDFITDIGCSCRKC